MRYSQQIIQLSASNSRDVFICYCSYFVLPETQNKEWLQSRHVLINMCFIIMKMISIALVKDSRIRSRDVVYSNGNTTELSSDCLRLRIVSISCNELHCLIY